MPTLGPAAYRPAAARGTESWHTRAQVVERDGLACECTSHAVRCGPRVAACCARVACGGRVRCESCARVFARQSCLFRGHHMATRVATRDALKSTQRRLACLTEHATRDATRWPPTMHTRCARARSTQRPHAGHTLATRWPHAGHTLATRWPHAGHTPATRRPHAGHTLATRWPQARRDSCGLCEPRACLIR
jgi:hypothetical protein